MATFEEMQTRIADDLNRPLADFTTQIKKAINRAVEFYEKERFWFNENVWSFSASSGIEHVAFSAAVTTDLKEIDEVTLTRSATDIYPMDAILYSDFRKLATSGTSNSQGAPFEYALFRNTWFFYPIPDQNYTVHVYGQRGYATLSASGDTNDFTAEAEDLIEARARWWLYQRVLKDVANASLAKAEEAEALSSLREKTVNLISTGRIKPA